MGRIINKKDVFTIPNIISMFRIVLLPVIVYYYAVAQDYFLAIVMLVLSGISDILDGFIARTYNMISDFGKIIDPVADKLTQGTLLICLALKYNEIFVIVGIFALKEMLMLILGYIIIKKKDSVNSARWYGKITTVVIYSTIVIMIVIPEIPPFAVKIIGTVCALVILGSLVMYTRFYQKILAEDK